MLDECDVATGFSMWKQLWSGSCVFPKRMGLRLQQLQLRSWFLPGFFFVI